MSATKDQFEPGQRIREYEIVERIAQGGMGAVYRARHVYLEEERAIKVIRAGLAEDSTIVERFIREARILVRLHHPNLVQLHEFGTLEDGSFFMVMEFSRGESVLQRLQRIERIPIVAAIQIVRETSLGLAAAHAQGIVHRDIAPDNLLLVQRPNHSEITKVIDFGIAKPLTEEAQSQQTLATGIFIGKPQYSSPEQCGSLGEGEIIDQRSDIYSLGVTFYQMLTGKLPFQADSAYTYLLKHASEEPAPPSSHFPEGEFPPELERIIQRSMAKRRDDRYASIGELLADLDEFSPPVNEVETKAPSRSRAAPGGLLRAGNVVAERYRIERFLNRGPAGTTYRAIDSMLSVPVALTILLPKLVSHPTAFERLQRDLELARGLAHPNVCRVQDFGQSDNGYYVASDLVEGRALTAVLNAEGALPLSIGMPIARQMLDGLQAVHQAGLVLRTMSPSSILIDERRRAYLTDVAYPAALNEVRSRKDSGSIEMPLYTAPEVHEGKEPDARSDLYSLGVLMFQIFTGRVPFAGTSPIRVVMMHLNSPPPKPSSIRPDLPLDLDKMLLRLLAKSPEARPANAAELMREVEALSTPGDAADVSREVLVHRSLLEGKFSQAIKVLDSLLQTDPGNARWKKLLDTARTERRSKEIRRARRLLKEKRLDQARTLIHRLSAAPVPNARLEGQVRKLREQLEAQAEAASVAESETARLDRADLDEAARLERSGHLDAALQKASELVQRNPDLESAHELVIHLRVAVEERDLARSLSEQVAQAVELLTSGRLEELSETLSSLQALAADTSQETEVARLVADLDEVRDRIAAEQYPEAAAAANTLGARHALLAPHDPALESYSKRVVDAHQRIAFEQLVTEGTRASREKRWEPAIRCFESALEIYPEEPAARQWLEAARARQQEAVTAEKKLRALLYQIGTSIRLQSWDEVLRLCSAARSQEFAEFLTAEDAETVAQTEVRAKTGRVQSAHQRAAALTTSGKLHQARMVYEKILEWDPQDARASERLQEVAARMEAAVQEWLERAAELEREQRWEEAIAAYREAAALGRAGDPGLQERVRDLEKRLSQQQHTRERFRAHGAAARDLIAAGDIAGAESELSQGESVLSGEPGLDDLRLELAAIRSDVERRSEQETTRLKLIEGFLGQARALAEEGEVEAAAGKVNDLLKAIPNQPEAIELRRALQSRLDDGRKAEREQMRQKLISDVLASARSLVESGELETAVEKIVDLLRAVPGHAEATRLRDLLQSQIARELACRDEFRQQADVCRTRIPWGDARGVREALARCQSAVQSGSRFDDLQMELAALEADVTAAFGRG